MYYNAYRSSFVCGSRPLRGITLLLKELVWPHFKLPPDGDSADRTWCATKGFGRGLRVSRELAQRVNHGKTSSRPHPFTVAVLSALEKNGLRPIRCEYAVASEANRLATAVDIVCRDREDKLHLIEVKTGMSNCWRKPQHNMQPPLQELTDCPMNQALVQLALTYRLFVEWNMGVAVKGCAVCHVTRQEKQLFADLYRPNMSDMCRYGELALQVLAARP